MRNACRGNRDARLPRLERVTLTEERRGEERRKEVGVRELSLVRECADPWEVARA